MLAALTLELVDVPSVSRDEAVIVAAVRERAAGTLTAFRLADDQDTCSLYLPATRRAGVPLVLFAGHLDTVPIAGNVPGRREGAIIHGRGASDQKAGIAVMLGLQRAIAAGELIPGGIDVGFLYTGREEIDESALAPCLVRHPELTDDVALAVVTEPTDNQIEAGCLGNLNARVTVRGVAAHSARPWLGRNAVHDAIRALGAIADLPVRDVEIDGLVYREVVNVTTLSGGVAANVIPHTLTATVNMRYAPTHTPAEAEDRLRELLGPTPAEVQVEVMSNAPGGPVAATHPLVQRLRSLGDLEVRPKQAWTPVAEFGEAGIPAINLGPGDPAFAHRDDEQVSEAAILAGFELCRRFIEEPA